MQTGLCKLVYFLVSIPTFQKTLAHKEHTVYIHHIQKTDRFREIALILNLIETSPIPLYRQLVEQLRAQILKGVIQSGQPLLSIRALAKKYNISVITVQKAYENLESQNYIESRRGKGFFTQPLSKKDRTNLAKKRFTKSFKQLWLDSLSNGLDKKTLQQAIREFIQEIESKHE